MPTSPEWVKDVYAERAKPGALLVTITPEGWDDPIRVTNWTEDLTVGSGPSAVVYHTAPFSFSWGGAGVGEPTRKSQMTIAAQGELIELVRMAEGQPPVYIERVRVASPGTAERVMKGRVITQAEISDGAIRIDLGGRDLATEYACKARYTQSRVPGLY